MSARIAIVRDRLIPSKKTLAAMRTSIEDSPAETAEWALAMLEDIRHDAREGHLEKYSPSERHAIEKAGLS